MAICEIPLLKELQHLNIVRLANVIHTEQELTRVFDVLDQDLKRLFDAATADWAPQRPSLPSASCSAGSPLAISSACCTATWSLIIVNIVYKAQDSKGDIHALKTICLEAEDEGILSTAIHEISLLMELQHPNILRLADAIHTERNLTLVVKLLDQDRKELLDVSYGGLDAATTQSSCSAGSLAHTRAWATSRGPTSTQ